jgi:hypothetical protein
LGCPPNGQKEDVEYFGILLTLSMKNAIIVLRALGLSYTGVLGRGKKVLNRKFRLDDSAK